MTRCLLASLCLALLVDSAAAQTTPVPLTVDTLSVIDFAWSPDGTVIAFTRLEPDNRQVLARVGSSGGAIVPLRTEQNMGRIAWSQDGQSLLTSHLDGTGQNRVYAHSAASGAVQYQSVPARVYPEFGPSRDLTQVIALGTPTDSTQQLVLLNLPLGSETPLATPSTLVFRPALRHANAILSYVYSTPDSNGLLQLKDNLYGSITARESCDVLMFDVSRAHGSIAYTSLEDGVSDSAFYQVYSVDQDNVTHRLTSIDGDHYLPQWSDDGQWLVYSRQDGLDLMNIYRVPRNGGPEFAMTSGPGVRRLGRLSPDGTRLAYLELETVGTTRYWRLWVRSVSVPAPMSGWWIFLFIPVAVWAASRVPRLRRVPQDA